MQTAHMPQAAKWGRWKLLGIVPLMLLAGCQSSSGTGALVGGGAGALLGNGIAKATGGSRTAGTAIGGILGAVGGAVVGDGMDQQRAKGRAEGAGLHFGDEANRHDSPVVRQFTEFGPSPFGGAKAQ